MLNSNLYKIQENLDKTASPQPISCNFEYSAQTWTRTYAALNVMRCEVKHQFISKRGLGIRVASVFYIEDSTIPNGLRILQMVLGMREKNFEFFD